MKRIFTWSTRAIHLRSSSAFLCRLKLWFAKKLKMNLLITLTNTSFCKYRDHAKTLIVFKTWCNCLNLMRDYFPIRDSKRLECVKKCFEKKKFYRIIKILDFFEHTLILTKCLVPYMLELTNVYYMNLILIILPSCCFLFKFFRRSLKLWSIKLSSIFLTKLLPTMTSIRLNYINSFWLFRKCIKISFCMSKHTDISKAIINFLML